MTPEEQRAYLLHRQDRHAKVHYWKRHAPVTFVVLVACVLASSFVQPLHWLSTIWFAVTGVTLYVGWATDYKGRVTAGGWLMVCGLIAAAAGTWLFAFRGSMMWVQGFGVVISAFCGSLVFHQAVGEERKGEA